MATESPSAPPVGAHDGNPAAEAAEAVHGHEVPAGASEVAAHGGEGGGLPQFEVEYWGGQIIWLLILFAILYFLFAKVFTPRYRKVVEARAETIAGALEEARRVQAEADNQAAAVKAEVEQARSSARKVVADANAKAAAELARSQAAEDARLNAELDQAEQRIRKMRDGAMTNVEAIAADTAKTIVEKLTGKAVTPAEAGALSATRS
ncbi:FoF1 ATP synthase B' chain [Phenylobacterium zucineum HLK1]|uniref:ATP synthase subunit b n=1 Tax=Phenylobacterium zucineum (strain HLK1) TaxID=450851 RepID=B4RF12_PHEZH|nr:FoF1 ATP synthase B' chain [Phenylobacterium zucineum]ACG77000.1 FoF1 ATP synthase B' chain [Phenylobacterium zucineum HLK1]